MLKRVKDKVAEKSEELSGMIPSPSLKSFGSNKSEGKKSFSKSNKSDSSQPTSPTEDAGAGGEGQRSGGLASSASTTTVRSGGSELSNESMTTAPSADAVIVGGGKEEVKQSESGGSKVTSPGLSVVISGSVGSDDSSLRGESLPTGGSGVGSALTIVPSPTFSPTSARNRDKVRIAQDHRDLTTTGGSSPLTMSRSADAARVASKRAASWHQSRAEASDVGFYNSTAVGGMDITDEPSSAAVAAGVPSDVGTTDDDDDDDDGDSDDDGDMEVVIEGGQVGSFSSTRRRLSAASLAWSGIKTRWNRKGTPESRAERKRKAALTKNVTRSAKAGSMTGGLTSPTHRPSSIMAPRKKWASLESMIGAAGLPEEVMGSYIEAFRENDMAAPGLFPHLTHEILLYLGIRVKDHRDAILEVARAVDWVDVANNQVSIATSAYSDFQSLPHFRKVYACIQLSRFVYGDEGDPVKMIGEEEKGGGRWGGIKRVSVTRNSHEQRYLIAEGANPEGQGDDIVYVAFEGTAKGEDVATDINFGAENNNLGSFHRGMLLRSKQLSLGPFLELLDTGRHVIFTGHSLGGAVAVVTLLRLVFEHPSGMRAAQMGRLHSITFGQPVVGDRALRDRVRNAGLDGLLHAYVDPWDVIPRAHVSATQLRSTLLNLGSSLVGTGESSSNVFSRIASSVGTEITRRTTDGLAEYAIIGNYCLLPDYSDDAKKSRAEAKAAKKAAKEARKARKRKKKGSSPGAAIQAFVEELISPNQPKRDHEGQELTEKSTECDPAEDDKEEVEKSPGGSRGSAEGKVEDEGEGDGASDDSESDARGFNPGMGDAFPDELIASTEEARAKQVLPLPMDDDEIEQWLHGRDLMSEQSVMHHRTAHYQSLIMAMMKTVLDDPSTGLAPLEVDRMFLEPCIDEVSVRSTGTHLKMTVRGANLAFSPLFTVTGPKKAVTVTPVNIAYEPFPAEHPAAMWRVGAEGVNPCGRSFTEHYCEMTLLIANKDNSIRTGSNLSVMTHFGEAEIEIKPGVIKPFTVLVGAAAAIGAMKLKELLRRAFSRALLLGTHNVDRPTSQGLLDALMMLHSVLLPGTGAEAGQGIATAYHNFFSGESNGSLANASTEAWEVFDQIANLFKDDGAWFGGLAATMKDRPSGGMEYKAYLKWLAGKRNVDLHHTPEVEFHMEHKMLSICGTEVTETGHLRVVYEMHRLRKLMMEDFVVVVMGSVGSGKSTLLARLWGLPTEPSAVLRSTGPRIYPIGHGDEPHFFAVDCAGAGNPNRDTEAGMPYMPFLASSIIVVVEAGRISQTEVRLVRDVKATGLPFLICANRADEVWRGGARSRDGMNSVLVNTATTLGVKREQVWVTCLEGADVIGKEVSTALKRIGVKRLGDIRRYLGGQVVEFGLPDAREVIQFQWTEHEEL